MPTEASWMFYLLGALLLAVGFEGDDGVKERGIGPLEMAFSEAVFLLRCSSETFLLHTAMNTPRPFDYEEYDPHRTLDDFFPHRRSPSTFARIPLQDPSPVTFNIQERPEFWSDAGRIVESTLLALSRVSTDIEVEISTTGEALSVSKKSVEAIVSAMVHPSPRSADLAEKSKGIRSYVAPGVGTGSAAVQAIRYHSNKTSSIMERVIRPSVYLLKQKLRGDASDWVSAKDLHPDELYLVRNSVRSMIDVLRLLMDSGAASPTPEQVLEGAEGECRSGAIRATSLLCLLDFYVMLLVYCTDPETELPFPAHESLVMEAVRIARSWDILDPAVDFKGYGPLYLHNSPPRAPSPELSDDEELSVSCQASRACMHIARLEISEETFMQREHWVPPMPIQEIIPRVLRPAVYLLHQALDPYYIGRICGPYHLSRTTYGMVRRALRKMLELVCLISLQRPEYPSYVQIWDGVMDHSVIPPEPIVSDRSKRVFEILSDLVDNYGFEGSERCEALELEHSLRHLSRVSSCWALLLQTRGEYPEYERSGRMMRCQFPPLEALRPFAIRGTPQSVSAARRSSGSGGTMASEPSPTPPSSADFSEADNMSIREAVTTILSVLDRVAFYVLSIEVQLKDHGPSMPRYDICVTSECLNMLRILRVFIDAFGFAGDDNTFQVQRYQEVLDALRVRAQGSFDILGTPKEFPQFDGCGRLVRPSTPASSFLIMALSFALLKDYRLDESPTLRLRSDFEVVYLDFDSEIEMSNYLRRPVMRQFCLEVLRPLRDVIMALRDRFRNASPVPRDSPWIRGQLGAYMIHIDKIFLAIDRSHPVGPYTRVPTPTPNSIAYMIQLVEQFGFIGDEFSWVEDDLKQKLRAVLEDEALRALSFRRGSSPLEGSCAERSIEVESFELDRRLLRLPGFPMADAELDAVRTFLPPRTVHELAQIPASLQILLPPYLLRVPLISAFTHPSYGVRAYFFDVVGPYARVINKGFPSRSSQPVDISPETRDFMLPHVGNLLKYLSIGYVIALESALNAATPLFVPPEAIRTLSLMQKFHMLLGHPSYGTGSGYEGVLLDMVNRMLKCARDSRSKTSDPIDIPYSSVMGHIPCVPSWTPEFIRVLEAQEIADPWIAERYWLRERVQDCDRVGKDLADLLADVAGGEWYPEVQF
ncbi:hypothetical protein DFH06DRAFT_1149954 [Mycena polygramma]|nr:hypothetical protein DFH06DRAFT_1149954 [Mycena polygramma]